MADINCVVLTGRLCKDSESQRTSGGTSFCKISLAVNRRRKSGEQWVDEASFFDIVIWGNMAESLSPYLVKGKQVAVQGELRQNRWEKDGKTNSKIEITASSVQLLGGKSESKPSRQEYQPQPGEAGLDDKFEDDIPF